MARGSILIVEANPGVMIVARNILAREGFAVYTSADPDDGIVRMRDALPDLVLLDAAYAWPEVIEDFCRASPINLPILVLVPNGMSDHILGDLKAEGANAVIGAIEKPFVPDNLIAAVSESMLDHKNTRPLEIKSEEFEVDPVVVNIATTKSEGLTYQETLDAEVACELLGVKPAVEVPGHDPEAIGAIRELRSALQHLDQPTPNVLEQTNPRASRLASRIRQQIPKGARSEWIDSAAFERAVARALAEDEVYGAVAMPDPNAVLAGRLGEVSVVHLIQFADGLGGRVRCTFEREYERIELTIDEHEVVAASHRNLPDHFRLGRFLTDAGLIDLKTLNKSVISARPFEKLGAMLCRLDLVAKEDVEHALTLQVEEVVFEVLGWTEGRFSLERTRPTNGPTSYPRPSGRPVAGVLLGGLQRLDEDGEPRAIRTMTRPEIMVRRRYDDVPS